MKFRVGDQVIVTCGKDKGYKGEIVKVLPTKNEVIVGGANLYTRHIKKQQGRAGEKMRLERALSTAKIAILNEKGEVDRIGYQTIDTQKMRIYKKTGTIITDNKKPAAETKKDKQADKKVVKETEKADKKNTEKK